MVANCVAQSVTDTQVEGKVQQFYFCIRALTTLQIRTIILIETKLAQWMTKQADGMDMATIMGTSVGRIAGALMKFAAQALDMMIKAQEVALIELDKVLDAICAKV